MAHTRSKLARFIFDNSLLLLAGTITAVVWANLDLGSYDRVTHPLHFWVNDVGMVFFFALAAKEVFEATLPGGPLASPRQAMCAACRGGRWHDRAGPYLPGSHVRRRPRRVEPRLGHSLRNRHRVFRDDRPRHLSEWASCNSVLVAPGDCRRCPRFDDPRRLLPLGPSLSRRASDTDDGSRAGSTLVKASRRSQLLALHTRPRVPLMGRALLRWLPSGLGARPRRALHAARCA